jgi:hypothetical protein
MFNGVHGRWRERHLRDLCNQHHLPLTRLEVCPWLSPQPVHNPAGHPAIPPGQTVRFQMVSHAPCEQMGGQGKHTGTTRRAEMSNVKNPANPPDPTDPTCRKSSRIEQTLSVWMTKHHRSNPPSSTSRTCKRGNQLCVVWENETGRGQKNCGVPLDNP